MTRINYVNALRACSEVIRAAEHIESDDFHDLPYEHRKKVIGDYAQKLTDWKSQIPKNLQSRRINQLELYISEHSH